MGGAGGSPGTPRVLRHMNFRSSRLPLHTPVVVISFLLLVDKEIWSYSSYTVQWGWGKEGITITATFLSHFLLSGVSLKESFWGSGF